jgi:hypothetical protein
MKLAGGAKAGKTNIPSNIYTSILEAPRLLPKTPPVSNTAKVCPVMGTVVVGIRMAICAKNTVMRANATITATSVRIPERGTITSMSVGACAVVDGLNMLIFYHILICFVTDRM